VIKELHKVDFKKFRQPQSKSNINDLDDIVGFHFIRQPDVESKLKNIDGKIGISVTKFYTKFLEEETGRDMENFESLAMVLIDYDYNGNEFVMDSVMFAEELLPKKKKKDEVDITEELKK